MPKIINKLIGKDKRRETSVTFPVLGISSSQGALAFLDLHDRILALLIHVSIEYKVNIRLFELSTNETQKIIDVADIHRLQSDVYKPLENDNVSSWLWDFLPAEIPNARIMTFGYYSASAFSKSVAKIEDKAFDFLNHLGVK